MSWLLYFVFQEANDLFKAKIYGRALSKYKKVINEGRYLTNHWWIHLLTPMKFNFNPSMDK